MVPIITATSTVIVLQDKPEIKTDVSFFLGGELLNAETHSFFYVYIFLGVIHVQPVAKHLLLGKA